MTAGINPTKIYTDRSRIQQMQRCARSRWYEYHEGPGQDALGITSIKKPLPLAVGGSVHEGLAILLAGGQALWDQGPQASEDQAQASWRALEQKAVVAALIDFSQFAPADDELGGSRLEVDLAERTPMEAAMAQAQGQQQAAGLIVEVEAEDVDPELAQEQAGQQHQRGLGWQAFEQYLYREQAALIEGLVRAYARRRLRPLLEEYEVLEVEREGQWRLAIMEKAVNIRQVQRRDEIAGLGPAQEWDIEETELWFLSRPDALLRHRLSNSLVLQSFKTAASWDVRKARDAEHDMQGLSEGIEIERRLADWWSVCRESQGGYPADGPSHGMSIAMFDFLRSQPTAPRILAVRYEYMLKGQRRKDKDLSARFGFEAYSQGTHLTRRMVAVSTPSKGKSEGQFQVGDSCWSWDYLHEDGSVGSLAWRNWRGQSVLDDMVMLDWINMLDQSAPVMSAEDPTVGLPPRELGWGGPAQALGYTAKHPLDQVFVAPLLVNRNEDDLRDLVDQMEAQEVRVARGVAEVRAARDDEGERRHLLNVHFGQSRSSCTYPSVCQFVSICYGGEHMRRDPIASGLFKIRTPNHPQEREVEGDPRSS